MFVILIMYLGEDAHNFFSSFLVVGPLKKRGGGKTPGTTKKNTFFYQLKKLPNLMNHKALRARELPCS